MSSFIAPQATTVAAFRVAGIAVRTTNAAEADPASARIGPLWDRFFSESWEHKLPPPGADGRVFGVYSGYASDQHGAFDVTAGVAAPADHQALQGATTVDIEAGTYLVFEAEGQMPQLVIDAWGAAYGQLADILAGEEGRIYKAQAAAPGGWSGARDFLVQEKSVESEEVTSFLLALYSAYYRLC